MYYEAPSGEKKKEMIESLAQYLFDNGLDSVAKLFLENYKPLAYIGTQFTIGMFSPFLFYSEKTTRDLDTNGLDFSRRKKI